MCYSKISVTLNPNKYVTNKKNRRLWDTLIDIAVCSWNGKKLLKEHSRNNQNYYDHLIIPEKYHAISQHAAKRNAL